MLVSVSVASGGVRNRQRNLQQLEISAIDDSARNGQNLAKSDIWRSGRVVEGSGFENRRGGNSTRGSNPFFSAERSHRELARDGFAQRGSRRSSSTRGGIMHAVRDSGEGDGDRLWRACGVAASPSLLLR